ncbi:hypothetical protein JOE49_003472 [Paenibacillus sp. PvR133]|nr:hypothetical protein [Paenibacillus sp. PvR133]
MICPPVLIKTKKVTPFNESYLSKSLVNIVSFIVNRLFYKTFSFFYLIIRSPFNPLPTYYVIVQIPI